VAGADLIDPLPLAGSDSSSGFTFEDFPLAPGQVPPILHNSYVTPGYFQTLGIPLIAGRSFERIDTARRGREILVSRSIAERFWPGKSPLGKRIANGLADGKTPWCTIVGVVGDIRVRSLDEKPIETVYFPMGRTESEGTDFTPRGFSLVVRGKGDPRPLAAPVRGIVRALDPNLPVSLVRPLREVVASSMARTSFTMLLLAIAAAVALLLGAVGIYGVISYVVSQRTREIGVRMALGAGRSDISRMVLREGLGITLLGIGIGLAAALAVTRLMLALLYGVSPTDPATLAAVPVLLAGVALLASWLPARRAASVEPLEAIRYE
jgi:putative ABC transport system permease protein